MGIKYLIMDGRARFDTDAALVLDGTPDTLKEARECMEDQAAFDPVIVIAEDDGKTLTNLRYLEG